MGSLGRADGEGSLIVEDENVREHRYATTEEVMRAYRAILPQHERAFRELARGPGAPEDETAANSLREMTNNGFRAFWRLGRKLATGTSWLRSTRGATFLLVAAWLRGWGGRRGLLWRWA